LKKKKKIKTSGADSRNVIYLYTIFHIFYVTEELTNFVHWNSIRFDGYTHTCYWRPY